MTRVARTAEQNATLAYLQRVPDDRAWARAAVAAYREMTPSRRLEALAALQAMVQALRGDRILEAQERPYPFWRRWIDPSLGRPS